MKPHRLHVEVGGFDAGYRRLNWRNGRLEGGVDGMFGLPEAPQDFVVEPSNEAWDGFLRGLEELRVWDWDKSYDNTDIRDGTLWEVSIRFGTRSKKSSGLNAYPFPDEGADPDLPSVCFKRFESLVDDLIGRKFFSV